jgi:hypothetical protein
MSNKLHILPAILKEQAGLVDKFNIRFQKCGNEFSREGNLVSLDFPLADQLDN